MNDVMALPIMEAPKQAAVESSQVKTRGKTVQDRYGNTDTEVKAPRDDFKKRLAECVEGNDCARQPAGIEGTDSGNKNTDNSMCQSSGIKEMLSGIVGILEGFELLDYQETDNAIALPEWLGKMLGKAEPQIAQMLGKAEPQIIETLALDTGQQPSGSMAGQEAEQSALLEQFARMLQDSQLGALPKTAQQEIIRTVGEVFSSFESTNKEKQPAEAKLPEGFKLDMDQLGMAMLKAKTVVKKQDADSATGEQTAKETAQGAAVIQPEVGAEKVLDTAPRFTEVDDTTGTMKETPEPSTFFKENAVRIVDTMKAQIGEGKSEFELQLKPDFLGKLNIKLTMENGEMKMLIKTQEIAAKSLLSEQLPAMQEMLREKGFAVTSADVVYEQPNMQQGDSHASARQSSGGYGKKRGSSKRFSLEPAAESIFYGAMQDAPMGYLAGSSMEFRA